MRKVKKPSKGRVVASKAAQRRKPAASQSTRRRKAIAAGPKRQPASVKAKRTPAKPKAKRAPLPARRRRVPAPPKGPSATVLQRRIQSFEEQLKTRDQDRIELARWRQYHSHLQEQVKAKDSALAFKEKDLLDLRRQVEELKADLKKETRA